MQKSLSKSPALHFVSLNIPDYNGTKRRVLKRTFKISFGDQEKEFLKKSQKTKTFNHLQEVESQVSPQLDADEVSVSPEHSPGAHSEAEHSVWAVAV